MGFNDVNRVVTIIYTKVVELRKRNMSFKDSKESRIILPNHVFQMSSRVTIVSPSDIPRED